MDNEAKIEQLQARWEADPKSRHFFPLAEELRKSHRLDEAEEVLRDGLGHNPAYVSAWICLGKVLVDRKSFGDAVGVLQKALSIDGENVVAARLLAESYLQIGEKVEAIKKFKLVNALMPNDETIEEQIASLERELSGAAPAVFDDTDQMPFGDVESEEPAPSHAGDVFADETSPLGEFQVGGAREELPEAGEADDVFASDDVPASGPVVDEGLDAEETGGGLPDDAIATVTMADLYARQGHHEEAIRIYERMLAADPDARDIAEKLAASRQALETAKAADDRAAASPESAADLLERKRRRLSQWLEMIESRRRSDRVS